jgi:hypothetical protein
VGRYMISNDNVRWHQELWLWTRANLRGLARSKENIDNRYGTILQQTIDDSFLTTDTICTSSCVGPFGATDIAGDPTSDLVHPFLRCRVDFAVPRSEL